MQIDPDEFCGELPPASNDDLSLCRADRGSVIVGVGKGSHSARRHLDLARMFRCMYLTGNGPEDRRYSELGQLCHNSFTCNVPFAFGRGEPGLKLTHTFHARYHSAGLL